MVLRTQKRALERVTGDHLQVGPGQRDHLSDELAETAGADEQHAVGGRDVDLLQNLECSS